MNIGPDGRKSKGVANLNYHGLPGLPQVQRGRAPPPKTAAPTPPPPPSIPKGPSIDVGRLAALESRVQNAEQSNRQLLDEMTRLQQDLRVTVKKNESGLIEERDGRIRLENGMRQVTAQVTDIDARTRRCEDGLRDSSNSITQLLNHTRNVEKAVTTGQQDAMARRDMDAQKLSELKMDLENSNRARAQLEQLISQVGSEVRGLSGRFDQQFQEVNSLKSNVSMQSKMVEDAQKMSQMSRNAEGKISSNLAMMLEGRIAQLNQQVGDIESRLAVNGSEISTYRIQQLQQEISEARRGRDAQAKQLELILKETLTTNNVERQKLLMQISGVTQQLKMDIDAKEKKLRQDTFLRLDPLEQKLGMMEKRVSESETKVEKGLQEQLKGAQNGTDELLTQLQRKIEEEHQLNQQKFHELTENQTTLEDALLETKQELERDIADESQERQKMEQVLEAKVEDLNDRLRLALANLQVAIGDVEQKAGSGKGKGGSTQVIQTGLSPEEVAKLQKQSVEGVRESTARQLGEMNEKIQELDLKVEQQQEMMNAKLKDRPKAGSDDEALDRVQQKVDSLAFSQERLKMQVQDLQDNSGKEEGESTGKLRIRVDELENQLSTKVDSEKREREDDVNDLRKKISRITGEGGEDGPGLDALRQDVETTKGGLRKVAEAIQVVKTTLGDKIKDEKQIREQETGTLKRDVEKLAERTKELRDRMRKAGIPKADTTAA